jgi:hypothetical protein
MVMFKIVIIAVFIAAVASRAWVRFFRKKAGVFTGDELLVFSVGNIHALA